MIESFNGLYKSELIYRKGTWRGLDDVEFATLEYVDWFNHQRLFHDLGRIPPAEFEDRYYGQNVSPEADETHAPSLRENPGRFTQTIAA